MSDESPRENQNPSPPKTLITQRVALINNLAPRFGPLARAVLKATSLEVILPHSASEAKRLCVLPATLQANAF